MKNLKAKYRLDALRTCLKGHYIHAELGNDNGFRFIDEFVSTILPSIRMLYVCHSVISPKKIPEIKSAIGNIPTMKFVDMLCSSFNHVIAWDLLQKFVNRKESCLFVDYFTARTTRAWEEMESNQNIFILPSGEYCNCLVSTADIFTKYVNDSLYKRKEKLGLEGISTVFGNKQVIEIKSNMFSDQVENDSKNGTKLYQSYISQLSKITPSSRRNIEVDAKLKHPVFFILTSQVLKKEMSILENTPVFDKLVNHAYSAQGCIRGINIDELENEIKYVKDGDQIVTIGDEALDKAKYLKRDFGLPASIITSNKLLQT